jgi:hypothetical protein
MDSHKNRLEFLRTYVWCLASVISTAGQDHLFLDYLSRIADGSLCPDPVDEVAWALMLPAERDATIFAHFHTMRTELADLLRRRQKLATRERVTSWLESPWVRTAVAATTLVEAAELLYRLLGPERFHFAAPTIDTIPASVMLES